MESKTYFPFPDSHGGWRTLTDPLEMLKRANMQKGKLDKVYEWIQKSTKSGGLLVLRNGWLVYENYFGKGHREATPNLASCGKSFTSIALGILMSQRPDLFPDGLDQQVFTPAYFPADAFPLTDPDKAGIKLGQLLAFTAGIRGNNPVSVYGQKKKIEPVGPDGWISNVDEVAYGKTDGEMNGTPFSCSTLWCKPGEGYSYATSSIHLVSILLRHVTGTELSDFIQEHLAGSLGWGRWGYAFRQHARDMMMHTPGGGGIALRSTDMLRFGYMLLRNGRWRDLQLVPSDYVRHCQAKSPYNPHSPYSLQFGVNTDGHLSDVPRDAFWKTGSGGHCLYIVPSLDLVVWKLGGRDEQYSFENTGLPVHPEAEASEKNSEGWTQSVDHESAIGQTLRMVIESIDG